MEKKKAVAISQNNIMNVPSLERFNIGPHKMEGTLLNVSKISPQEGAGISYRGAFSSHLSFPAD